jgi:protein NrfD
MEPIYEITTTRQNALVDPVVRVWGWDIAYYLFLSGITAGVLILAAAVVLAGREDRFRFTTGWAAIASPFILGFGMLGLFYNVENKWNILAFYLYFNPVSPKAWGAWGLLLAQPVGVLFGLSVLSPRLRGIACHVPLMPRIIAQLTRLRRPLAWTALAFGLFLGTYTGVLLSTNVGRPLWNTAMLAPLFLVSGLSAAAALLTLLARDPREKAFLTRLDVALL